MADDLEAPESIDDLYLARGDDVNGCRPYLQGDVFENVAIPGVDGPPGLAVITTHPCSMRGKGGLVRERVQCARIGSSNALRFDQWKTSHFRFLPMPELRETDEHFAAEYEMCGRVLTADLATVRRSACLTPLGICLLQQRLVFSLTRVVVPTRRLLQVSENIFEEVELQEAWISAATEAGVDVQTATRDCDAFLSQPRGPSTLRNDLKDAAKRAPARRAVGGEITLRYAKP